MFGCICDTVVDVINAKTNISQTCQQDIVSTQTDFKLRKKLDDEADEAAPLRPRRPSKRGASTAGGGEYHAGACWSRERSGTLLECLFLLITWLLFSIVYLWCVDVRCALPRGTCCDVLRNLSGPLMIASPSFVPIQRHTPRRSGP